MIVSSYRGGCNDLDIDGANERERESHAPSVQSNTDAAFVSANGYL
jgi:hypothetical protein